MYAVCFTLFLIWHIDAQLILGTRETESDTNSLQYDPHSLSYIKRKYNEEDMLNSI